MCQRQIGGTIVGRLIYDHESKFTFDDRILAHLQLAMSLKLRRKESFFFTFAVDQREGGGRVMLWIDPTIPLQFRFDGGRIPTINRAWLEQLVALASTAQGLTLTREAEPLTPTSESPTP